MIKSIKKRDTIYWRTKLIIKILAAIMAVLFSWLQFDMSFQPIMTDEVSNLIFKTSLALYYFSWIFGTTGDMSDEEYSLKVLPHGNKLSGSAIGVILSLALIFALLCLANTYKLFILALSLLLIFNVFSWLYIVKFIKPTFFENKDLVNSNADIEYQNVLEAYLTGRWQWYRFGVAAVYLLILNILVFSGWINQLANVLKMNPQFLMSLTIMIYIVGFEAWVWIKRLERIFVFHALNRLTEKYSLRKKIRNEEQA